MREKTDNSATDRMIEEMQKEIVKITKNKDSEKQHRIGIEEESKRYRDENKRLRDHINVLEMEKQKREDKIAQMKSENNILKNQAGELQKEKEALKGQVEENKRVEELLKKDREAKKIQSTNMEKLKKETMQYKDLAQKTIIEKARYKNENRELHEKIETLESVNEALEIQLEKEIARNENERKGSNE